MMRSPFAEFDAATPPKLGDRSVAGHHRSSGLAVRLHFPPLSRHELLDRVLARLRFDSPGLPRLLHYGTSTGAAGELPPQTPYYVTEALDPVGPDDLPKRWPVLRDRLGQLLECLCEAHAHNSFHGALGYSWLFRQPDSDPLRLCVEGWFLDGSGKIPEGLRPLMIAPECSDVSAISPASLVQMDLYGVGYLGWGLACGTAARPRQTSENLARFEPQFKMPSGFAQWLQNLLQIRAENRPRAAADALQHLLEVDRLRRTVPPGSVAKRLPELTPTHPTRGLSPEEMQASIPLLAQRRVPMVGRTRLKAELWRQMRAVGDSRKMRLVILRGSAGAGKSRLADWLYRSVRRGGYADGFQVRHSQSPSPSAGILGALRRYLQTDGLDAAALLERCKAWLERAGETREPIAKLLAALVHDGGGMTPQQRQQTLQTLLRLLAENQPLLLWIEDLQWGQDSLEFLSQLLTGPEIPNLLIVATLREEALVERADEATLVEHILTAPQASALQVDGLSDEAMTELTQQHLHLEPKSAQALCARSEGNPLFAIQWVNHAIVEKMLTVGDAGLELTAASLQEMPHDALRICMQRIDSVLALLPKHQSDGGLAALTAAAVLGSPFRLEEWLGACARLSFENPQQLMRLAKARQLIRPTGGQFTFAHGLLREALLLGARDKEILGTVKEACGEALLDAFHAGRRDVADRLYGLFKDSGQLEEALAPLLVAADSAKEAYDLQRSEALLGEAASICDQIGLDDDAPARIRLLTFQSELHCLNRTLGEAFERASLAETKAESSAFPELAARARLAMAMATFYQGKLPEALGYFRDLTTTNEQLNSPRHQAQSMIGTAMVLENLGELDEAGSVLQAALELVSDVDASHAAVRARALRHLAAIDQTQGGLEKAQAHLSEALMLENLLGNQPALLTTMSFMGDLCLRLRRPKTARQLFSDAADGLQALGSKQAYHPLLHLAYLTMEDGDLIALAGRCEQLRSLAEANRSPRQSVTVLALELWLSAQRGDWPRWDAQVQHMIESYAQHPVFSQRFGRALGDAALRAGRNGQAKRALPILELSLGVLTQLGAFSERARISAAFRPFERI